MSAAPRLGTAGHHALEATLDCDAASRVALTTFDRLVTATAAHDRWAVRRCHIGLRAVGLDVVISRPLAKPAEAADAFAALVRAMALRDFVAAWEARKRLRSLDVSVAIVAPKAERGRA